MSTKYFSDALKCLSYRFTPQHKEKIDDHSEKWSNVPF